MKIKCKVCRKDTIINELDYTPEEKVVVECARCGNELEAIIPLREVAQSSLNKEEIVKSSVADKAQAPDHAPSNQDDLKAVWYSSGKDESKTKASDKNIADSPKEASSIHPSVCENNRKQQPVHKAYHTQHRENNKNYAKNTDKSIEGSSSNSSWVYIILGLGIFIGIIFWVYKSVATNNSSDYGTEVDSVYVAGVQEAIEVAEEEAYTEPKISTTNSDEETFSESISGSELEDGGQLQQGYNKIEGAAIVGSNRYPFYVDFTVENGTIRNAEYHNPNYNAKTALSVINITDDEYYFEGKLSGKPLIIRFSNNYPYRGKLIHGSDSLDIEMSL